MRRQFPASARSFFIGPRMRAIRSLCVAAAPFCCAAAIRQPNDLDAALRSDARGARAMIFKLSAFSGEVTMSHDRRRCSDCALSRLAARLRGEGSRGSEDG